MRSSMHTVSLQMYKAAQMVSPFGPLRVVGAPFKLGVGEGEIAPYYAATGSDAETRETLLVIFQGIKDPRP